METPTEQLPPYYIKSPTSELLGPFSLDEVKTLWQQGQIPLNSLIKRDDWEEWQIFSVELFEEAPLPPLADRRCDPYLQYMIDKNRTSAESAFDPTFLKEVIVENVKGLFNLRGRMRKKSYWIWVILIFLITSVMEKIIIGNFFGEPLAHFWKEYSLCLILIFSSTVRRLHDVGKSGWNSLWFLIPFVGVFVIMYYCFLPSDLNENKYDESND